MAQLSRKLFRVLLVFLTGWLPAVAVVDMNNIQEHLDEFSDYTLIHHENIDDTNEAHAHVHKHSADGAEHEHHHEHSKAFQTSTTGMYLPTVCTMSFPECDPSVGFAEHKLISNPHTFGIFRPPIV
ncbi:MAG: hypothetical protein AB7F59_03400 [Bdellovibrionales bacterium]